MNTLGFPPLQSYRKSSLMGLYIGSLLGLEKLVEL